MCVCGGGGGVFALACKWIFIEINSTESRFVIGPENLLFAGVSAHHQPGNFTGWGSEVVNNKTHF